MAGVVTISATFGAQGSVIGPAVAERLGAPFVARAIPYTVAAEIGCTLEAALEHDGRTAHGLGRLLSRAARRPNVSSMTTIERVTPMSGTFTGRIRPIRRSMIWSSTVRGWQRRPVPTSS